MPSSVKGSALYNPAKGHGLWKPHKKQKQQGVRSRLDRCYLVLGGQMAVMLWRMGN